MRIKIIDKPVRQNVELFLQILHRVKQKQLQKTLPPEKFFKAWLNRQTGEISFNGPEEESLRLRKRQWKPIELSYRYDSLTGEILFLVQEAGRVEGVFSSDDLNPLAFRVLRETMKTFSEIGQRLKGPSDLNTKISVLVKLTIEAEVSHGDRNILIDIWYYVDRIQAESLLQDKPIGTYLFRQDIYAKELEEQLENRLGKKVKCFTLTYSQKDNMISELVFVHIEGTWQIYNDDPLLEQKKFSDLNDLVSSLKHVLRYPLYTL